MIFSSLFFICIFLPVTLILYYAVPRRFQNALLLIMSLIFYAWGEPVYVLLMIFSIVFNYAAGLLMRDLKQLNRIRRRKIVFIFTVAVNLALLGFFKYCDFLLGSINSVFGTQIPLRNIALPIGISFYTFQILSYVIDVYREKVPVQEHILDFGAYISMFPQLIAGPIVRYEDIRLQLEERTMSLQKIAEGSVWFIRGLCKKVLLANNIGMLYDSLLAIAPQERAVFSTWLMALAYTLQIYFDFSGYSDMAVGLGKMLGFQFVQNFNYPYLASSATEFWRRWHISLGTWFREYVYIPMGGNRCSKPKYIRNILVVWFLTGLWHGADWTFVIWGLYYGALLLLEKLLLNRWTGKWPRAVRHVGTLILVIFGWVIFSSGSIKQLGETICSGFGGYHTPFFDSTAMYWFGTSLLLILVCMLSSTPLPSRGFQLLYTRLGKAGQVIGTVLYCLMFAASMAYLVNATYNPFLYFRF